MCIQTGKLDDGTEIWCRKCWQCIDHRIEDWVGRCIAESKTSKASYAVTLTYADIPENGASSAVLTYADVQLFLKRLRKRYGRVRFLCAGEYGSLKGRCHWHLVLFFQDKPPEVAEGPEWRLQDQIVVAKDLRTKDGKRRADPDARNDFDLWSVVTPEGQVARGYTYWENVTPEALAYVCKYVVKQEHETESEKTLQMSKKPPLGDAYFRDLAERIADQCLWPSAPVYEHQGVRKKDGSIQTFALFGKTAENLVKRVRFILAARGVSVREPEWVQKVERRWETAESRETRKRADEVGPQISPKRTRYWAESLTYQTEWGRALPQWTLDIGGGVSLEYAVVEDGRRRRPLVTVKSEEWSDAEWLDVEKGGVGQIGAVLREIGAPSWQISEALRRLNQRLSRPLVAVPRHEIL